MKRVVAVTVLCVCVLFCILWWRQYAERGSLHIRPPSQDGIATQQETSSYLHATSSPQTGKALLNVADDFTDDERDFPFPEARRALRLGAEAKITLRVVDSRGVPVEGAAVTAGLYPETEAVAKYANGATDENGIFIIEGKTKSFIDYVIQKEGYYMAKNGRYWVYKASTPCVKDGRWIPWNPMIEIKIKEKRNQIQMYKKTVDVEFPKTDKRIGYDFEKGDWLQPYGKGYTADIYMQYAEPIIIPGKTAKRVLTVAFPNEKDGLFIYRKDETTAMFSIYEAEDVDYQNTDTFLMEWEDGNLITKKMLGETDYFVFRTRAETDENGNIISAHYGKIEGPLKFGIGREKNISFIYYFNPIPNDRNLEYGGNLFDERRQR